MESKKLRRIAVSRLHFPNGRVLYNQVVEVEGELPKSHFPLTVELASTEWLGGDYFWKE